MRDFTTQRSISVWKLLNTHTQLNASRRDSRNCYTVEMAKELQPWMKWANLRLLENVKIDTVVPEWETPHFASCIQALTTYGFVCYARTMHIGSLENRYVKSYFGSVCMTCFSALFFPFCRYTTQTQDCSIRNSNGFVCVHYSDSVWDR